MAAHLVAPTMGLPHIVRTAGSDAGRVWLLPQYQGLYDEILAAAEAIICSPGVASKMAAVAGPAAQVISTPGKHENLSDLFSPGGPVSRHRKFRAGSDRTLRYGISPAVLRNVRPLTAVCRRLREAWQRQGHFCLACCAEKHEERRPARGASRHGTRTAIGPAPEPGSRAGLRSAGRDRANSISSALEGARFPSEPALRSAVWSRTSPSSFTIPWWPGRSCCAAVA